MLFWRPCLFRWYTLTVDKVFWTYRVFCTWSILMICSYTFLNSVHQWNTDKYQFGEIGKQRCLSTHSWMSWICMSSLCETDRMLQIQVLCIARLKRRNPMYWIALNTKCLHETTKALPRSLRLIWNLFTENKMSCYRTMQNWFFAIIRLVSP